MGPKMIVCVKIGSRPYLINAKKNVCANVESSARNKT